MNRDAIDKVIENSLGRTDEFDFICSYCPEPHHAKWQNGKLFISNMESMLEGHAKWHEQIDKFKCEHCTHGKHLHTLPKPRQYGEDYDE